MTAEPTHLDALASSVHRLREVAEPLDDAAIVRPAYPSEWTIAQVLSHIGSGAVIFRRFLEAELAGTGVADDLAPSVWGEWDAKTPRAQVDDALAADAAFVDALAEVPEAEKGRLSFSFGPFTADYARFVSMRLTEHVVHTWDVEVAVDERATIPLSAAAIVAGHLDIVARRTAKPTPGDPRRVEVRLTDSDRSFTVNLTAEGATLAPADEPVEGADLELPTEAFVRLVYGRLDPDHSPAVTGDAGLLHRLRATYPGL